MERSWWIILVLICNLAYSQINSGALSNNRFLQRTNPQITRALNDGGSSLDHPEMQKLARQMVDLGIWSNLVFWVHEGLVKERVSGSDVFIPAAYDISGNLRDALQASTANQPKLVSNFMQFDNIDDRLVISFSYGITEVTYSGYANVYSARGQDSRLIERSADRIWFISVAGSEFAIQYAHSFTSGGRNASTADNIPYNTWFHFAITYNANSTANNPIIYINGLDISATIGGTPTGTRALSTSTTIGSALTADRPYDGNISDFRMFNKILTPSEIDAIFQETRGKYGI
jgi:hypothetical protein